MISSTVHPVNSVESASPMLMVTDTGLFAVWIGRDAIFSRRFSVRETALSGGELFLAD
jgi:hypothetical protein